MGNRRRAREAALQILFLQDFAVTPLTAEQSLGLYIDNFELLDESREFAEKLVRGTIDNKVEIQNLVEAHSTHWKLDRMAAVDKNIIRMAAFELKYLSGEVPPSVVINEAIEIGKKFGSLESGAFINGVLDNILKALGHRK